MSVTRNKCEDELWNYCFGGLWVALKNNCDVLHQGGLHYV